MFFNSRALCFRLWLGNEVSEAEAGKYLCQKWCRTAQEGGKGLHHEALVETEDSSLEPVFKTLSVLSLQNQIRK